MMDRRLQRAPDAEWVLMYRLGLSRQRIADLVRVPAAVIGYHLVIARRQDPVLGAEHHATASAAPIPYPSPTDPARMEESIAWVKTEGRLPDDRSPDRGERSLARWLSARRRESAEGTLDPAYGHELAQLPGWAENRREPADEARWHEHLAELVDFRQEGHDWPRHHDSDSEREHTLGVWIHAQRYKRHRGDLDPVKPSSWTIPFPDSRPGGPGAAVPGRDRKTAFPGAVTTGRTPRGDGIGLQEGKH